jgi:hypothetical protein
MIKIYDASDKVFIGMASWWQDLVKLVAIEEMKESPHIFRIYQWKNPSPTREKLTLIIRDKHLAQQDFNSLDTARDLLQKFTLKGDVAKKQQNNG